jgi:hypothetical protein
MFAPKGSILPDTHVLPVATMALPPLPLANVVPRVTMALPALPPIYKLPVAILIPPVIFTAPVELLVAWVLLVKFKTPLCVPPVLLTVAPVSVPHKSRLNP